MTTLIKTSAKNTITVVGDDIAAGSENFSELQNSREFPIILEVVKGAFINKIILIPIVLGISYFLPHLIVYILLFASFYLAYEGYESFIELFFTNGQKHEEKISEKEKIKGSIKIDFILSLEIVLIALASVENQPFIKQALVVTLVSFLMVFVIYGTILFIVKIDDIGYFIYKIGTKHKNKTLVLFGKKLIKFMANLLKILPYIGLYAVCYVSGEIFFHNIEKEFSVFSILTEYKYFYLLSFLIYPLYTIVVGFIIFQIIKFTRGKQ